MGFEDLVAAAEALGSIGTLGVLGLIIFKAGRWAGMFQNDLQQITSEVQGTRAELSGVNRKIGDIHRRVDHLDEKNDVAHAAIVREHAKLEVNVASRLSRIESKATCLLPNLPGGNGSQQR